jgi:hypothetical protein
MILGEQFSIASKEMEKHGFKGVFFDDDRHNSQVSVF